MKFISQTLLYSIYTFLSNFLQISFLVLNIISSQVAF